MLLELLKKKQITTNKMKKILLLMVCLQLVISCGYAPIDASGHVIITSIEQRNASYCYYYGQGNTNLNFTFSSELFKIKDECGKFQIGDTITFTKINK
jgi:hypothetical protein